MARQGLINYVFIRKAWGNKRYKYKLELWKIPAKYRS